MPKKRSEHYVNNKELLDAMIDYRIKVKRAKENGDLPHQSAIILAIVFLRLQLTCHTNQTLQLHVPRGYDW